MVNGRCVCDPSHRFWREFNLPTLLLPLTTQLNCFSHDVLLRYVPTKTMHPSAPSHRVIFIFSRTAFRAAPDLLNDWKRLRYHYQCKHSMNKNIIIYSIIMRILQIFLQQLSLAFKRWTALISNATMKQYITVSFVQQTSLRILLANLI